MQHTSPLGLAQLAINVGDTTPAAPKAGNLVWSTTTSTILQWTGVSWQSLTAASGGAAFTGATSAAAGASGAVPAPAAGAQNQFLKGDGTFSRSAPLWVLANAYTLGDKVLKGNMLYTANANIPASTAFLSGTTGATWLPIDDPKISQTFDLGQGAALARPDPGFVSGFTMALANRGIPGFRGLNGILSPLQPALFGKKVAQILVSQNSTGFAGAGFPNILTLGTITTVTPTAASRYTRMSRLRYLSAATAGSFGAQYHTNPLATVGDGTSIGGFFYNCRFGVSDAASVAGARMFVGMRNAVSAPTNVEPNTLTQVLGVCQSSTSNNLQLIWGGSAAATVFDLGSNFPANSLSTDIYDLYIYAPPDSVSVWLQVVRWSAGSLVPIVAGGIVPGTTSVAFPSSGTLLQHAAWRTNNTTALAVGLDVSSLYLETDF